MKRNRRIRKTTVHSLVTILIVLVLGACTSPFGPSEASFHADDANLSGGQGTLLIEVHGNVSSGDSLGASTVIPHIDLTTVDAYRVTLNGGPAGAPVPEPVEAAAGPDGSFQGPAEINDLVPGTWSVTVEALGTRDGAVTPLLRGIRENVPVQAGESVQVEITLEPPMDGTGSLAFSATWPESRGITALDYRIGSGGEPAHWTSLSTDQFTVTGADVSVSVVLPELASGTYLLTLRLDAGPLRADRYRAYAEEVVYVFENMTTIAEFELVEDHFTLRPPEPGSWEELEEQGIVVINPDGSLTFTDTGYTAPSGGDNIFIDPDDYSVSFSASGERRLYMNMPGVRTARLEILGALMTQGNGWGVFFHGSTQETGQFSGYTLQFDPGLGDRIVVREWVSGGERAPFISIDAAEYGIDLREAKNIFLEVDGPALRVLVEQPPGSSAVTVIDETDITLLPNVTGSARLEGFMGLRNWSTTNLTVQEIKLYVFD
ncbi:MAG: carboxypeptidase regulatory-like domain-containing protein [Spirochaetaceae bacterium]|nr:MAG: carboxypeptidase regulatory-like domain-containing protein [Spirochaetaceae bacterium]